MTHSAALRALCVTALGLVAGPRALAQSSGIEWSGRAFLDYTYLFASDDDEAEGHHTFDYRRLYLTADAPLGDGFSARAQLEAQGRTQTERGLPVPFVKDAWVRWDYAAAGHQVTLGVQPSPAFEVAEGVWGYRSLDRTVSDRAGVQDSRDLGLRFDGPLAGGGALRYAVMVANGNGIRPEEDGERGKHLYGQLRAAPGDVFRASLGADYVREAPPGDVGRSSARASAFVGAVTDGYRVGVEAFYARDTFDDRALPSQDAAGVSVFGALNPTVRTSVIARYDHIDATGRIGADGHYVLVALAYRPVPAVSVMPNAIVTVPEGTEAGVLGRITVDARF